MLTKIFFIVLIQSINAIDVQGNCTYVRGERNYYIYSPNFPIKYKGENHCYWTADGDEFLQVNCSVDLPASKDCLEDVLSLDVNGAEFHNYCGSGRTSKHKGDEISIKFNSVPESRGGTFFCEVQNTGELHCTCGWKNLAKIAGGESTGINEYPAMAGIIDIRERRLYCGATIINEYQVLTAASCVNDRTSNSLGILVGDHDITKGSETNATKLFRVDNIAIHPQYQTNGDDIAIITISGKIEFNQAVGPACLPFQHSPDSFAGFYVDILGWGRLKDNGTQATELQRIEISVITNKDCREYLPSLRQNEMCTFTEGKDTCQLDGGGPLLWRNPFTKRVILIGVLSEQSRCDGEFPSVATRVGAYIDWIVSELPSGTHYCKDE